MPSKNRVWTTVAEDYNSPLTRNEIWTRGMARYPEFLGTDAVTIGIVGRDGNINYIADMNSWQHVHEQLKAKALKENTFVEKLIDRALAFGEETNLWSQKYIHDVSLTKASPNKLIRLYHEVYEREETLYALGTGLVILDFHDFSFVEGNLKKFLNALPEAEEFYRTNVETKHQEIKQVSTIKGACACKGNARGIVKIINTPADMKKMNEGDILVSIATTPSIIAAMKKAAAFITDEGGLTCHASIVSRELNTPCVVGTKIATKVLKDGDEVEVDATNGIIRKL